MTNRSYRQGEPEFIESGTASCGIDECGAQAVLMVQGKEAVKWCREGHVAIKVWFDDQHNPGQVQWEWVAVNSNYAWE